MKRKKVKVEKEPELISYGMFWKFLAAVIATEIAVVIITSFVFHSFVDQWGFKVYYETLVMPFMAEGKLPYINTFWEYPVLMLVPVVIAATPAVIFNIPQIFFLSFPAVMTIFQAGTCFLVYLLTLNIFHNKSRAAFAGYLYAFGITAAYITLTNFDPMPAFLVMLGLTCTICWNKDYGYLSYILGFFTKIYPVTILPFLLLYNSKVSSVKREVMDMVNICIAPALALLLPFLIFNPQSTLETYTISNAAGKPIFAESFVFAVYSWVNDVAGLPLTVTTVANIMTTIMAGIFVILLYLAYSYPGRDPSDLLAMTLIALTALIACSKYHSPQYMLWIMPILCVLVSGDIIKSCLYYLMQIIWYIKFPLLFWGFYTNVEYVPPLKSSGWWTILIFFTVEYLILFYLVWKATDLNYVKTETMLQVKPC